MDSRNEYRSSFVSFCGVVSGAVAEEAAGRRAGAGAGVAALWAGADDVDAAGAVPPLRRPERPRRRLRRRRRRRRRRRGRRGAAAAGRPALAPQVAHRSLGRTPQGDFPFPLPSFTEFYLVFLGFTRFLPSFTQFYSVLIRAIITPLALMKLIFTKL